MSDASTIDHEEKRRPPKKEKGQGLGPRKIDGLALGVREAAALIGDSEKALRGQVSRGVVPFRRRSGRIIFIREELVAWMTALPGVTLIEATRNQQMRSGGEE